MMEASGGQLVVQSLLTERVRRVFTVPGESFLAVLDALYDTADEIDVVSTRHEEGAGFMADSYAKASGEVGVCMVTRGVGVTNLSIALHTARQDSTPLVALVGQVPTQFRYREAFQEVDLDRFLSPIVKWAIEIPTSERVAELMQQAFRVARSERPGPVVVGLPEDVLSGMADAATARPPIVVSSPRPDAEAVAVAYDAIHSASRPVVVAGREILTTGSTGRLVEMSEQLAVPVMTAFRRFDAFPNDHANYAGNIALGTPKAALKPLEEADLVIGLGTRFTEVTTNGYDYPKVETPILHVTASAELAGVWGAQVTPIVAGVDKFLSDLEAHHGERGPGTDELPPGRTEAIRRYREIYERVSRFDEPVPDFDGTSISQVVEAISSRAPRNTAITTDAGNFSAWVSRYYPFVEPMTHFAPISGAMGYGLPGAIGASFADRDRLVFAFAGDGGFAMTMSELAVVAEHRLKVVSLVFVNGQYGTIRMHQQKHFPDRRVATTLHNPSFVAIGNAFGLDSFRVSNNAEFERVLDDLIADPRPALVEIMEGNERLTAWGNFKG